MKVALITGSGGLIGSEAAVFLSDKFDRIIGIDNNQREYFFGKDGSISWNLDRIQKLLANYKHYQTDIRDYNGLERIFSEYGNSIKMIVHAAAQPSHDWAAKEPLTDFSINATGTLNILELTRKHSPKAVFIFTSTNKVYGDTPNLLPLVELEGRYELEEAHPFYKDGIDETMSIDHATHSIFGASKVAADVMAQEYGKYFDLNVGIFRCGCLTGPNHSGAQLHGFLAYLMKCVVTNSPYTIFGYKGKQVRDNIHSADLVSMFWHFYHNPFPGEVYNVGGGRFANCSMLEAIGLCEKIAGKKLRFTYSDKNRIGDHIWWISNNSKFKSHYPNWQPQYDLQRTLIEIFESFTSRIKT